MKTSKNDFKKSKVKLVCQDGNVFNLIGICSRALKNAGYPDMAKEMSEKIFACSSYDNALGIMIDYCEVS
jgi:hypothetical protein